MESFSDGDQGEKEVLIDGAFADEMLVNRVCGIRSLEDDEDVILLDVLRGFSGDGTGRTIVGADATKEADVDAFGGEARPTNLYETSERRVGAFPLLSFILRTCGRPIKIVLRPSQSLSSFALTRNCFPGETAPAKSSFASKRASAALSVSA